MTLQEIIIHLRNASTPATLEGIKRFGVDTTHAMGVSIPSLRAIAKQVKNR